jgi:hypothetical protein
VANCSKNNNKLSQIHQGLGLSRPFGCPSCFHEKPKAAVLVSQVIFPCPKHVKSGLHYVNQTCGELKCFCVSVSSQFLGQPMGREWLLPN